MFEEMEVPEARVRQVEETHIGTRRELQSQITLGEEIQ